MRNIKKSRNQWIGNIPSNWDFSKFKYCTFIYTGNSIKDEMKGNYEDSDNAKPYISSKDINRLFSTVDYDNGMYVKNDDYSFKVAHNGDTLMCIEGGSAGKKKAIVDRDICFVNKLCCFHPKGGITSRFLYYYLSSPSYEDEFFCNMTGMIGGVSTSRLLDFDIVLPPIDEQNRIISFLDNECYRIDTLTCDIQKQIDALEDYKRSVITEAITKGIKNNVKLKNTGFQYWNLIPENWKLIDVKYLFEIVKRIAGKEGFDIISVTQKGLRIKDISGNEGQIAESYVKYQFVYPTDYVMNHMDLLTGWVDYSTMFGVTSPDYRVFRLRSKTNNLSYYKYVLQSCYFNKTFYSLGNGVSTLGRWRLQTDSFNNFLFPVPPVEEQNEIADFLNKKCSDIDLIIDSRREQLNVLENYKKALIYEYVTGKKEVPNE